MKPWVLLALAACSPATGKAVRDEGPISIEVGSYGVKVGMCREKARDGFDACVAAGGEKLDCKATWLARFDACACDVDREYHHDAGVCS